MQAGKALKTAAAFMLSVAMLATGAFFVAGMLLMAYNTYRTVRAAKPAEYEAAAQIPAGVAH